jgi:hypothetical protein
MKSSRRLYGLSFPLFLISTSYYQIRFITGSTAFPFLASTTSTREGSAGDESREGAPESKRSAEYARPQNAAGPIGV